MIRVRRILESVERPSAGQRAAREKRLYAWRRVAESLRLRSWAMLVASCPSPPDAQQGPRLSERTETRYLKTFEDLMHGWKGHEVEFFVPQLAAVLVTSGSQSRNMHVSETGRKEGKRREGKGRRLAIDRVGHRSPPRAAGSNGIVLRAVRDLRPS